MKTHLCLIGDAGSIHLRRWAQAMVQRDFRVSVISTSVASIEGAEIIVLPLPRRAWDWFLRLGALRRAVRSLAPDIVHAHYVTSYGLWGAASSGRPLVLTAWGSDILVTPRRSHALRILTGWILRQASLITADSRDVLTEIGRYRPSGSLHEIFWGADVTQFHPNPSDRRPGFHVASMRAWEANYQIDVIVEAFSRFLAKSPQCDATLHLFGGGSQENSLHSLVERLGISKHVIWHGLLPPHALAHELALCDVSISVPQSDATSVSLLESMACSLPAIVSDLPANRQWIDASGGYVVPVGDVDAVATSLCEVFENPAVREQKGAFNRKKIEEVGSSNQQMDLMAVLYASLGRCRKNERVTSASGKR
ncbi:putative glycosyltransferase, family 1 [Variovorax paradoxus B4]|uniref:Putative glycosyltransferase, family 1 n=1 Tax=Variovorax paradoxus B4 TaxID=1246301 RepID=T1XJC8_VARPD|nr:putative glycosyltransferase, family 1 [Variovorax paradoxus B4]